MNFKRIAGYASVGALACVGAVVMLPVAGAVGTVTLVGAVVSGSLGTLVGTGAACATDKTDEVDEAERRGRQRGANDAKAKCAQQWADMNARYEALSQHMTQQKDLEKLHLAMFSVGAACLRRCGAINDDNVAALKEFVFGVGFAALPAAILDEVNSIAAKPPTLKTAFTRARKLEPQMQALFDKMVAVAAYLNDNSGKHELMAEWTLLRAA